jgi:hypothetical protein
MLALLALGTSAWVLIAQDSAHPPRDHQRPQRREGPPGPNGHHPPPPIIHVLDANHDGVIDAKEIANASKALLQLDKDGDGQLTREELRPPPPDDFDGPPPDGEGRPPGPPPGDR